MTTITALPDPPNPLTDSQSAFNSKALAFTQALPTFATEANAVAVEVNANAATATTQAGMATTQAALAAAAAASAMAAPGTNATSTSSVSIGTGSKGFTIETGKAYSAGQTILIADSANPTTNWMWGQISTYNSGAGALTVNILVTGGSGTIASWIVSISAAPGVAVVPGDLTFAGTDQRIRGDFSGSTFSRRVLFQSSISNGNTIVGAIPNGTGTSSGFRFTNSSDTTNNDYLSVASGATEHSISSLAMGTGTVRPIAVKTNGTTALTIGTSQDVIVGTAALATSATSGFFWIPSCAGAPTGSPTAPYTNAAAAIADTTNSRFYVRIGSTWKYATLN